MTEPKSEQTIRIKSTEEHDWKVSFRRAKREAEAELQEIHRDAANRVRDLLKRAS